MERRDFFKLVAGTIIALPVGSFLVASCGGSDDDDTGSDTPAAAPRASGTSTVYSSSRNESHFHELTVENSMFTTPSASGLSGTTSNDLGHTHTVQVSMAQLASVGTGQTVKITSSNEGGHAHVITLVKLA